jgi:hypothetical protein
VASAATAVLKKSCCAGPSYQSVDEERAALGKHSVDALLHYVGP